MNIQRVLLFIALTCYLSVFNVYPQAGQTDISGSWLGSIDAGGITLRIVFNLELQDGNMYMATMDSPDQGAKGIPLGDVILTADTIVIKAPNLAGEYAGVIDKEDEVSGTWTQGGRKFNLDLKKSRGELAINRPQEPKPPFPYSSMDMEFRNPVAKINLAGTVTYPSEKGRYPAVVLVSGSGPQDRNEELMGHKPFAVLADFLTRNGIVVLRYDDRGVGKSGGSFEGSTSADFADDASAATDYLKTLDFVDPAKVGIIGHSEGGLIAFMLAARIDDLAFIITLAGPGCSGRTIIEDQTEYISRLNGVPEATIKESQLINSLIYDIIEENENITRGVERVKDTVRYYYSQKGYKSEIVDQIVTNIGTSINPLSYRWLRYFYMADPGDYFESVSCPVFALNGSKDCQVLADVNIEGISNGLAKSNSKKVDTRIYPDLNHLFQHCETGLLNEYSQIEETISPEVLNDIAGWISDLFR